jgi:AcrR family transcriptional regulator
MPAKETRERILEAALELFRERGFAEATMRDIARQAGVATGLAYYYFKSKDAIVLAFYQRARVDLVERLEAAQKDTRLAARLKALIEAKFEYFRPNRRFLGALMPHAADAANPLSPFSEESRDTREFDIAHFERAIAETDTRVSADLAPHLGKILWFYQMGLILFWIHDRSAHQIRTRHLLDKSLEIVVMLIKLSNVPLMRPARKRVLDIMGVLTQ